MVSAWLLAEPAFGLAVGAKVVVQPTDRTDGAEVGVSSFGWDNGHCAF